MDLWAQKKKTVMGHLKTTVSGAQTTAAVLTLDKSDIGRIGESNLVLYTKTRALLFKVFNLYMN